MIIKVVEMCEVDYIDENDEERDEPYISFRTVIYETPKTTLFEAFEEYTNNFNPDNVINSDDGFEGTCLDVLGINSVEEVI